jgi:hypothetical protein
LLSVMVFMFAPGDQVRRRRSRPAAIESSIQILVYL